MIEKKVVEVVGLKKSYRSPMTRKKVEALNNVSFSIHAGVITGFLGANGAGKTTTIKCLLELAFADSGDVKFFGKPGLSSEAKSKIGFLPERPYFYDYLTGREFLKFYGQLSGRIPRSELDGRASLSLERVGLSHAGDRPLRGYSKGMLQRIGIAQALIHKPEFIILDEPMTGLDPDGRHEVREIIREVASQGTAVFFSSHHLSDAESLCERLVILKKGHLVYEGRTDALMNRVDSNWHISFAKRPGGPAEKTVAKTIDDLQKQIDTIRAAGGEIRDVGSQKISLEEIFIKMAFDPKTDAHPEASR